MWETGLSAGARQELEALGLAVILRGPVFSMPVQGCVRPPQDTNHSSVLSQDPRFQTPRSSLPERSTRNVDAHEYPVSPGGTIIRPPPGPPPSSAWVLEPDQMEPSPPVTTVTQTEVSERPEEPAKYISELPKLTPPELSHSAVTCGNWLAQVRQVFQGLSHSATVWWSCVEQAANFQYQRWLRADPLDRLLLDPSTVIASFDAHRYQRVESRAVTLMLAAIPTHLRDEAVSNRWLSASALLFRIQCVYQPGGSSERSMLLSQLVSPDVMKSCAGAVSALRKWQQSFNRVKELHAALPDSSLLLKGIDGATASLLSQYPGLSFRVSSFRNRASLDYNPSVTTVLQLVRLLQAEFEAASLTMDLGPPDKRPRNAVAQLAGPLEVPYLRFLLLLRLQTPWLRLLSLGMRERQRKG